MRTAARRSLTIFHMYVLRWWMQLHNLSETIRLLTRTHDDIHEGKVMVVTIRNFNHGRYGFQLLNYFSKAGYGIWFHKSFGFLLRLHGYDRMIWSLPRTAIWRRDRRSDMPSVPWLTLGSDGRMTPPFNVSVRFNVDLRYFEPPIEGSRYYHLPYFAHPLLSGYIPMIPGKALRRSVFMYGAPDIPYDRDSIEGRFGLMSRGNVYSQILDSELPKFMPEDFDELMGWLKAPEEQTRTLCLVDGRKFRVPLEHWFEVLSRFDFFVATPGFCMPHSHNLMEAMAAATVPILQYHDQLRPALRPGVDCLGFHDERSLLDTLRETLGMEASHVDRLRSGITRYFADHVYPNAVVEKILRKAEGSSAIRLYFNAEEFSLPGCKAAV